MKSKKQTGTLFLACLLLAILVPAMGAAPGDILYERIEPENGEDSNIEAFPPSIFPHWVHRVHYRCDTCHDSLFEMKPGATLVTMDLMEEGKVCGACHNGKLAFDDSFENCARCHRAPTD